MNVACHLILKKSKCRRKDLLRQVSLVRAQSWIHPSGLDGRALCSLFALSPCLILRSGAVGQLASFISSRSQVRFLPPQQMQNAVGTGYFITVSYGGITDDPRPFSACRFCIFLNGCRSVELLLAILSTTIKMLTFVSPRLLHRFFRKQ